MKPKVMDTKHIEPKMGKCLFCKIPTDQKDWSGSGVFVCPTHNGNDQQLEAESKETFYCSVPEVNKSLAIECVEEFLEDGKNPMEVYIAWMIDEGYDMEVFS